MGHQDVRDELELVTPETRDDSQLFQDIRKIGKTFESGLDSLLFSRVFEDLTRSNAIF